MLCDQVTARALVRDANPSIPALLPSAGEMVSIEAAEWNNGAYGSFADTGTKLVLDSSGVGEFSGYFERAGKMKIRAYYPGTTLDASTSTEVETHTSPAAPLPVSPSGTITLPPNSAYVYSVTFAAPVPGCNVRPKGDATLSVARKTANNGLLPLPGKTLPLDPLGSGSFLFSAPGVGTYELKASFPGDANFLGVTSSVLTVVVAEKLMTAQPEAPGSNCQYGGQRLDTGLDLDGNGVLAGAEISSTQFVCNGAPGATGDAGTPGLDGTNGHASLVNVTDQAADTRCPAGGKRIDQGLDLDDDGVLDDAEIVSTAYACNGVAGAPGAAGESGPGGKNSLVSLVDEAAGANCPAGGKAIHVGLDADGNGKLESSEVTTTSYVCNGAAGAQGEDGASACSTTGAGPAAWMLALATASALRRRRND